MKHLALRCFSTNSKGQRYTCAGLGDRIHSVTCVWCYARKHDTPVTLHVDATKSVGGQFGNKLESWNEIVSLFPAGWVQVCHWAAEPKTEAHWMALLASAGVNAAVWRYGDFPGPHEGKGFDISPYLRDIPKLTAAPFSVDLPIGRFGTEQWDAGGASRRPSRKAQEAARARYADHALVRVGGEATGPLRTSLKAIAYAMVNAEFHVGADSAFMHMAQLYMPWERIHIYASDRPSHHVRRARHFGARVESLCHHAGG